MDDMNTSFVFGWPIFRGDVSFREGKVQGHLNRIGSYSKELSPLCFITVGRKCGKFFVKNGHVFLFRASNRPLMFLLVHDDQYLGSCQNPGSQ